MIDWKPIDTLHPGRRAWVNFFLLANAKKRWVRIGRFYPEMGRWYYSATAERSMFVQNDGDEPTHWTELNLPNDTPES